MNSTAAHTRVLAIDGGGTRCRFALASGCYQNDRLTLIEQADIRIVVECGPANATSDFNATVHCIIEGLKSLANTAQIPLDALHALPAFVGLAGVTGQTIATQLTNTLPLLNACYTEDRIAAVRGACGVADGFIAHCGTGSFLASQINRQHRFAGGWGPILGDEASAQWLGRKALSLTVQQADGFLPASSLTRELFNLYKTTDDIVEFCSSATPRQFGKLAPIVTRLASNGDPNAILIMRKAADYIARSFQQMDYTAGMPVCLTGGVAPYYEPFLPDELTNHLTQPAGSPLDGAIQLAFEHAEKNA